MQSEELWVVMYASVIAAVLLGMEHRDLQRVKEKIDLGWRIVKRVTDFVWDRWNAEFAICEFDTLAEELTEAVAYRYLSIALAPSNPSLAVQLFQTAANMSSHLGTQIKHGVSHETLPS